MRVQSRAQGHSHWHSYVGCVPEEGLRRSGETTAGELLFDSTSLRRVGPTLLLARFGASAGSSFCSGRWSLSWLRSSARWLPRASIYSGGFERSVLSARRPLTIAG